MDKIKMYEKLGARWFQKVVFKAEKIKFRLLKPFSKGIVRFSENLIDRKLERCLKREKDLDKRSQFIFYFNKEKLKTRIEFNSEKNRNYHLNHLDPKETIKYLNINKKIHIRGIKYNLCWLGGSFIGMIIGGILFPIGVVLAIYEIFSIGVNFECINLQNYNILRIEQRMEKLEKIREKRMQKKIEKYSSVSSVVAPLLSQSKTLPKSDEIVRMINTQKELEEMRNLIDEVIKSKESKERKLIL